MRWSEDGTTLATAAEDGALKTWSRNGMLRNTIDRVGAPIYSLSWGSDSDAIIYSSDCKLHLKAPG